MKCPHCQADNREGAEFCRKCGKSLKSNVVCPQCGHVNLPDSAFCEKCARSLGEAPISTQVSAQPTAFDIKEFREMKMQPSLERSEA